MQTVIVELQTSWESARSYTENPSETRNREYLEEWGDVGQVTKQRVNETEVNVNPWDFMGFSHSLHFCLAFSVPFQTHFHRTGMFSAARASLRLNVAAASVCFLFLFPFMGQWWWMWASVPLGGVFLLLQHFPLTYFSYPPNMKDVWRKIVLGVFTRPDSMLLTSVQCNWDFCMFHNSAFLLRPWLINQKRK